MDNVEIFRMVRADFIKPDSDSWMADRVAANEGKSAGLAGWYWWTCVPGCMPDSDAFGPFPSAAVARRDAEESHNG
jgi:hypothetical protein